MRSFYHIPIVIFLSSPCVYWKNEEMRKRSDDHFPQLVPIYIYMKIKPTEMIVIVKLPIYIKSDILYIDARYIIKVVIVSIS